MIELRNVIKTYEDFRMSLDATIRRGELVSLLGPSGSGKTTTLRLIAGFERPDSGSIVMDGRDVTNADPSKRKIGFVFQDYTLFPHMTVERNVGYGLRPGRSGRAERDRRVASLLSTVNLDGFGRRNVNTLSGGEQQRAAIARALAPGPVLLLLDEPFSSIDAPLRRELRDEVVRLRDRTGVTTVFVTHSRQEALSISDRVAVMCDGSIVQFDTPAALYERPVNRFVASFVGDANFFTGRVSRTDADRFEVSGFIPMTVSRMTGRPPEPGSELLLMVRPDRIRFADGREPAGANGFHAVLKSARFFGHFHEYRLMSGDIPITAFDREKRTVGETFRLYFESGDAVPLGD